MPARIFQVAALTLAGLAFSASAAPWNKSTSGVVPYSANGKSASMGAGANGSSVVSGRNPGEPIGKSGWYRGGGAETNPATGATMTMGANGDVFFPGTKYPWQAGYEVPRSAVAEAAAAVVGGWPGMALAAGMAAYPYVKDWFDSAGITPNPDGTYSQRDPGITCTSAGCGMYRVTVGSQVAAWGSMLAMCQQAASRYDTADGARTHKCRATGPESVTVDMINHAGVVNEDWYNATAEKRVFDESEVQRMNIPASSVPPELAKYAPKNGILRDVYDAGGTINIPTPTVSGPASTQGEPTVTETTGSQTVDGQQVPTKTTTTSTTTYNFTTNNNQITNTSNVTTTTTVTVNQSTGAVISSGTTTTTEKPKEEDDRSECEKNPKSLACAELDTPEGEIPRKQLDISFQPQDLGLGNGTCPAPVQLGPGKVFSYQATCDNLHLIKPMVIAIAFFMGAMIVFGVRGGADQ